MRHGKGEKPSLELLIESEDIGLDVFHPGGLNITEELAGLCHIKKDARVLDVASGTGESAFFLEAAFGCVVTGLDSSAHMVERAEEKAVRKQSGVTFLKGDAHNLPFDGDFFDAAISECTFCLFDKDRAIGEVFRVIRPGGYVGVHDVCWRGYVPGRIKEKLAEIENERPETLQGMRDLFMKAGLIDVITIDKPNLTSQWSREVSKRIGTPGKLRIFLKVLKKWGPVGLARIIESEKIFRSKYMGYGITVGKKPESIRK